MPICWQQACRQGRITGVLMKRIDIECEDDFAPAVLRKSFELRGRNFLVAILIKEEQGSPIAGIFTAYRGSNRLGTASTAFEEPDVPPDPVSMPSLRSVCSNNANAAWSISNEE